MDFATLGVSIKRDGSVVATTSELDKFSDASQRAEIASGKLYNAKFNKEARDYAATVAKATANLRGFDAIAARAAQNAQHMASQVAKLTSWDVRNSEIQQYGRELDDLRARFNPMFAAQQRFKAVSDEINHAQRVGAITANEATSALMREQAAYEAATASINANTAAVRGNGAAVMSAGARRAHAINLMQQGQDVVMMSLLGQDPRMLALQQGPQVGAIFSQMGNGRAVVQGLTSAIGMMLNPLNLATIATIGLGAAGVQAFMSMGNEADGATEALETNREKMERLLNGYARAKGVVDSIFEAAAKLPQGVVMSDLNASLREQEQAAKDLNGMISNNNTALAETIAFFEEIRRIGQSGGGGDSDALDQAVKQIEMLRTLGVDMNSTRAELEAGAVAAREFFNATEDEALRQMADDAYQLIMRLIGIKDEASAAGAALRNIPRDIQIRISMSNVFSDAMSDINSLYMDPRNRFDQARDELKLRSQAAQESARSMSELTALAKDHDRVLASINAAEAEANSKSFAKAAKEADKPRQAYADLIKGAQDFIASQAIEQQALGMTAEAAQRLRFEQDLLNKAANDNIALTPTMRDELVGLAAQMAATEDQTRRLTQAANDNAALWSQAQDGVSSIIKTWARGGDVLDTFADKLGQIGDMLIDMAVRDLFANAFGGTTGGGGGNFLGGVMDWLGGLFGGNRASGGPVEPGKIYRVNENTPNSEWFSPSVAGTILPNHAVSAGGGASTITYGDLQVTIGSVVANSEAEGAAAARGFQREMKRWQESGEGKRFVRDAMQKMGRAN